MASKQGDLWVKANRRLQELRQRRELPLEAEVIVLCYGHQGPLPKRSRVGDIVDELGRSDLLDGAIAGDPVFASVAHVLEGQLPEELGH